MTEAAGTFFGVQHFDRRVRERLAVLAQHQIAFGPAIPVRTIMSREVERQRAPARVVQIEREVLQERKQREFEEQARRRAVTEAEKIALRAKIFANLGLGPDGMCPTKPPVLLQAEEKRAADGEARRVLTSQELHISRSMMVSPGDYLKAKQQRAVDKASLTAMSSEEIEACAVQDVRPSDYIVTRGVIARGVSTEVMQQEPQRNIPSSNNSGNDPMFDLAVESLAKYSADKNPDHLFYAQAAIARMLKRS